MDGRRPSQSPARPLVLVLEPDDDTREMYAFALSAFGFETVTADDEAQALHRARVIRPDIIVTDLPVPNYDGWEFLQGLKENRRTRDIPVIVVSGYAEQPVRERVERDGFAGFFTKPCPPEALAVGLRQVLSGGANARVEH
jgi:CheY-like chemotaxis protein